MLPNTNYKTNVNEYSNRDLSTIFSPLNNMAYGYYGSSGAVFVKEMWTGNYVEPVVTKNGDSTTPLIEIVNTNITLDPNYPSENQSTVVYGFKILNPGIYRFTSSFIFSANSNEDDQPMFIILARNSGPNSLADVLTGSDYYGFTPNPTLTKILSMNCSAMANEGTIDGPTNNNTKNTLENRNVPYTINLTKEIVDGTQYFFRTSLRSDPLNPSIVYANYLSIDMTFIVEQSDIDTSDGLGMNFYPEMTCKFSDGQDPYLYLQPSLSTWSFTKLA